MYGLTQQAPDILKFPIKKKLKVYLIKIGYVRAKTMIKNQLKTFNQHLTSSPLRNRKIINVSCEF